MACPNSSPDQTPVYFSFMDPDFGGIDWKKIHSLKVENCALIGRQNWGL